MSIEIIPVIDLMGGIVVQGRGGDRENYTPINSVLTQHTDLINVITDFLNLGAFNTIYIADLDAIMMQQNNTSLYSQLSRLFPSITFWIDAGIQSYQHWLDVRQTGVIPVIGSETLQEVAWLENEQDAILSLDFQSEQFLGSEQLINHPELWPNHVIVMNLDYVGSDLGPDLRLIKKIQTFGSDINIVAAGGVRTNRDLVMLEQEKIKKVLIASALHTGCITLK
jgi:phosphoribosylformimino-5-aminoimidazole carboxamide ribotide isomerase